MNLASLSGQIPGEIKVEEYSVVDRAVQCHVQVAAINKAVQTVDNESELLSIGRVFYGMNYETLEGTHENQSEDEPINGDHIVQSVYNSIFYIKELLGPNSSHTPFTNITQLCSKFTGLEEDNRETDARILTSLPRINRIKKQESRNNYCISEIQCIRMDKPCSSNQDQNGPTGFKKVPIQVEPYWVVDTAVNCDLPPKRMYDKANQTGWLVSKWMEVGRVMTEVIKIEDLEALHPKTDDNIKQEGMQILRRVYDSIKLIKESFGALHKETPFTNIGYFVAGICGVSKGSVYKLCRKRIEYRRKIGPKAGTSSTKYGQGKFGKQYREGRAPKGTRPRGRPKKKPAEVEPDSSEPDEQEEEELESELHSDEEMFAEQGEMMKQEIPDTFFEEMQEQPNQNKHEIEDKVKIEQIDPDED
ncbi:hypothetical protein WR25_24911 [Diploscapter pachys]|uniref:Uncharacterized protein n=1 Tax=Diploscapter pachys TaxID=2018661 RepID=A0A2A2LC44_9BILA|nr:hypothetical protein WR25_24911 [Diploscapter pachys]